MNNAALIVSRSLLKTYNKKVELGKLSFKIYQPTLKELCIIFEGVNSGLRDNITRVELMAELMENRVDTALLLSRIIGIKKGGVYKRMLYKYIMRYASIDQQKTAMKIFAYVVQGVELFENVEFAKTHSETVSEVVGNNTILGVVSSFMENLKLSFHDAFEVIPYPVLLMMNADKLRVLGPDETIVKNVAARGIMNSKNVE